MKNHKLSISLPGLLKWEWEQLLLAWHIGICMYVYSSWSYFSFLLGKIYYVTCKHKHNYEQYCNYQTENFIYNWLWGIVLNWIEWVNDCRHADIKASGELSWQPMIFEEEPASQLGEFEGMGRQQKQTASITL